MMRLVLAFILVLFGVDCQAASRDCVVHKEISTVQEASSPGRYKHGNCSLAEFAGFIQSDKLGGFVELKQGEVNDFMSQCLYKHPYSYLYIQFPCGIVDFEFINQHERGVVVSRIRFGYYESQKNDFITYAQVDLNEHLQANQSYDCQNQVLLSSPCVEGKNCDRLHLQQVKLEPFRWTNKAEFTFNDTHHCEASGAAKETLHDLKKD